MSNYYPEEVEIEVATAASGCVLVVCLFFSSFGFYSHMRTLIFNLEDSSKVFSLHNVLNVVCVLIGCRWRM